MVREVWRRLRDLGTLVEDELYELTQEEEREEEPPGRNTVAVLLSSFLTLWKASEANVVERVLGLWGLLSALWLLVVDRGMGVKRTPLRLAALTGATLWFLPGALATLASLRNVGLENLRRPRLWPLLLIFTAGGLISFRAVFGELARDRLRPQRGRP
ncbi:MAG: hypothetical protein RQ985_03060 [Dehalococcoidia bacterium]|jgi:hypothetical protein|nr:hypothetical protein [Dehalococcoidia bacterium]